VNPHWATRQQKGLIICFHIIWVTRQIKPLTVNNVFETKLRQILFLQLPMTRLGEMVNLQNDNSSKKSTCQKCQPGVCNIKHHRFDIFRFHNKLVCFVTGNIKDTCLLRIWLKLRICYVLYQRPQSAWVILSLDCLFL
jgi:hypothetical protein